MFHCYILRSVKTGRRSVGSCEDIDKRLARHNGGKVAASKHSVPWTLIHSKEFATRAEAVRRELYYKTGAGRDELDRLDQRAISATRRTIDLSLIIVAMVFPALAAASLLCAQEAAAPTVEVVPKQTARTTPSAAASVEPTIPPDLPDVAKLDEMFKQSSLGRKADEFRLHAEWRRLRNQIANAPDVVAAKKASDAARTDLEKRQLLRRYYEICYAHMQALASQPDVKTGLQEMKVQHLKTLDQPQVRPSASPLPTRPSEKAEESPTTSPSPTATPEAESESSQ